MTTIALLKSNLSHQGGLEKYTLKIAHALADKGLNVTILTSGPIPPLKSNLTAISLLSPPRLSVLHLKKFDQACKRWFLDNPTDIILGLDRNTHQTHYRAGNGVHKVYLEKRKSIEPFFKKLSFKFNPLHRTLLEYEKKAFEDPKLKKLITNSLMVKKEIITHFKIDPSKVDVVHNGVEWDELSSHFQKSDPLKETLLKEKGLDPNKFQFLFVGHGWKRKGLEYIFHGLSLLPKDSYHLSVVGKDKNKHFFEKLATSLGLHKNITFFGPQNSIYPYYQLADSLVIPSLYDPFANVTVEALAMGLFVVSSSFNGACEILNQHNGTVIDDLFNPDSVAESLKIALKHPKKPVQSLKIRNSVKHLNFNNQLNLFIQKILDQ